MNSTDAGNVPRKKSLRHWLKVLRPISWWIILVLILYTVRTHQILSRETCLSFDASIEGRRSDVVPATLDGNPIINGTQVGVGRHRLTFTHRKAETITTNLFVWYGGCDLQDVVLQRSKGTLSLAVSPAAQLLTVFGPEFRIELTNSIGITSSVPSDAYRITAYWLNHLETNHATVTPNHDTAIHYSPFLGTVLILSEPAGARVIGRNGKEIGITPLTLEEVSTGIWKGELRLDGFVTANMALAVVPGQTNSFQTNLINWQYALAIQEARRLYAAGDYDRALEAVEGALKANNGDSDAKSLREKIAVARYLQRGRNLYEQSRYTDARQELEAASRVEPENSEVKALLLIATTREEEVLLEQRNRQAQQLADQTRRERLERLDRTMESVSREHLDGGLFDVQRLTLTNSVKELGRVIQDALMTKPPTFEVQKYNWINEEFFVLEAKQQVPGGLRQCVIVGTQAGDRETVLVFRVLEYETHLNLNFGGVFRVSDGQPPLVALPNRRDRIVEGIQSVTSRIQSSVPR